MSEKQVYEKTDPPITPTGLRGIRTETNTRLREMLESLVKDILATPECEGVTAQFIADEITYGMHRQLGWGKDIQIYAQELINRKGNP